MSPQNRIARGGGVAIFILKRYATAFTIDGIPLITRGAVDLLVNPPLAAGDVQISKDGGAFTNIEGADAFASYVAVVPTGGRYVQIKGHVADMTCKKLVIQIVDQTSPKAFEDQTIWVYSYGNASAAFGFDFDILQLTAADIWGIATTSLTGAGSIGKLLVDNITASISAVPAAVWTVATSALTGANTIGKLLVDNVNAKVGDVAASVWAIATSALTATGTIGKWILDKLDVVVSTRGTSNLAAGAAMTLTSDYDAAKTAAAPGAKMDVVDAPNTTGLAAIAAAIWAIPTALLTTAGTIGKWVMDKLDIAVSTRGTYSGSPPTAGDNATAVAAAILVTPAQKIATDAQGRVTASNSTVIDYQAVRNALAKALGEDVEVEEGSIDELLATLHADVTAISVKGPGGPSILRVHAKSVIDNTPLPECIVRLRLTDDLTSEGYWGDVTDTEGNAYFSGAYSQEAFVELIKFGHDFNNPYPVTFPAEGE